MTIAVTPFDGLCGFRPLVEIVHFLSHVPSLRKLVGNSVAKEFEEAVSGHDTSNSPEDVEKNKKALQAAFTALMNVERSAVATAAKELIASAKADAESFAGNGGPSNGGQELADLVVRLNSQFEGDIGLFVLFFLNYVKLEIGEAMFLKADDIHAYLSGGMFPSLTPMSPLCSQAPSCKTLSNVWHHLTTWSVLASRLNIKTSQRSRACSRTRTRLSHRRRCRRPTTRT